MKKHVSISIGSVQVEDARKKLNNLPSSPGVYQFRDKGGNLLYIGKASSVRSRVRQYFQKRPTGSPRLDIMIKKIHDLEVILTDSDVEALILEANLVKEYNPRYNVRLKDDKSFPYIVITNEPYPRVFVTRTIKKDGSKYFGPYTDVKTMRYALKTIRDVFRIRSCNYFIDEEFIRKEKVRVCLDYHIRKCDGPCEGLISEKDYNRMMGQVEMLLKGETESLIDELNKEMIFLSDEMKYEEAAEYRDKIDALKVYTEHQKVEGVDDIDRDLIVIAAEDDDACGVVFAIRNGKLIGRQHYYLENIEGKTEDEIAESFIERYYLTSEYIPREIMVQQRFENASLIEQWFSERSGDDVSVIIPSSDDEKKLVRMCRLNAKYLLDELKLRKQKRGEFIPKSVKLLGEVLRMDKPPMRIDCFDVSNIQESDIVGAMVCFVSGKPKKSEYRKFKLTDLPHPDDFASIRQIVYRRYRKIKEEQKQFPDLIVIDGGKGQLSSALTALKELDLSHIPIIGLAKRLEEIYLPNIPEPQTLPKTSPALRLLQRIRDEAHRFAVTYHRKVRTKRVIQTELDLIDGVGKKRAKMLLDVFGSVQGVKHASEEQLAEVIGPKVAEKVVMHFQKEVEEFD